MPTRPAIMVAAPPVPAPAPAPAPEAVAACGSAQVIDLDEVAQRCERLAAYADQTRNVVVYRFLIPAGATVAALGGGHRDAQGQLDLVVGLTGGSLSGARGQLAARIPKILAAQFEAVAGPLIAAFLVSLDLGDAEAGARV